MTFDALGKSSDAEARRHFFSGHISRHLHAGVLIGYFISCLDQGARPDACKACACVTCLMNTVMLCTPFGSHYQQGGLLLRRITTGRSTRN